MRALKTFMRNRKADMLWCGPCECRTLQCWRYANENCGCGEKRQIINDVFYAVQTNEGPQFFMINMDEENIENYIGVYDDYVAMWNWSGIWDDDLTAPMWREMRQSLDAECVRKLFGGEDVFVWSWRLKAEAITKFNTFLNNPTDESENELRSWLIMQCSNENPLVEKISDDCIIRFTSYCYEFEPRDAIETQISSDLVRLSKKSVIVPAWTIIRVDYSEDENDVLYIFYDENDNEIDRVVSNVPTRDSKYTYYAFDWPTYQYSIWRDGDRDGWVIKAPTEIPTVWCKEQLTTLNVQVLPEWAWTTNIQKIMVRHGTNLQIASSKSPIEFRDSGNKTISVTPADDYRFDYRDLNGVSFSDQHEQTVNDDSILTAHMSYEDPLR